jgi:hypothetical protein
VSLKYDATAPTLAKIDVTLGDRSATLTWQKPADTTMVQVVRTPGRKGSRASAVYTGDANAFRDSGLHAGTSYRYTLTSVDTAGNRAAAIVKARPLVAYAPGPGERVRAGAVLRWVGDPKAAYYNLQLFRNGRKVLSAWPLGASFKLPRSWTYAGRSHRLRPGTYRWYVWPGYGKRSAAKYGARLGGSYFRIA